METAMVWIVFGLGVLLILVGVVAIFMGIASKDATLKFLGLEIKGSGGALVLVAGLALILAGMTSVGVLDRKRTLAETTAQLEVKADELQQANVLLQQSVQPTDLARLRLAHPRIFTPREVMIPAKIQFDVNQARRTLRPR